MLHHYTLNKICFFRIKAIKDMTVNQDGQWLSKETTCSSASLTFHSFARNRSEISASDQIAAVAAKPDT